MCIIISVDSMYLQTERLLLLFALVKTAVLTFAVDSQNES